MLFLLENKHQGKIQSKVIHLLEKETDRDQREKKDQNSLNENSLPSPLICFIRHVCAEEKMKHACLHLQVLYK